MVSVDLKGLIENLNDVCTSTLHGAAGLCVSRTHYEITLEHFILKILEDINADWFFILKYFSIDIEKLRKLVEQSLENLKTGNSGKPVFSPILIELFADSWLISSVDFKDNQIRSASLLISLLKRPNFYLLEKYGELLKKINLQNLEDNFWEILKNSKENPATREEKAKTSSEKTGSFLVRFCIDFTKKAKEGKIDPVFGRDKEIRQIIDILGRRRKNNPICVGEPGVGKTAVVEGLALRIAEGDVPDFLKEVSLLGLDLGLLEAGAGMKGEFENRLKGVIEEVKSSEKPIILFIDEAHTLVGAGGSQGGSDAANLLKPALARGELRTIAATTWSEYKKYFEKDPALARRFQLVKLDEPNVETTKLILRGIKENYEKAHKVIVRDDAIEAAASLANKYITGRFLPDKAIDLLDTSCARVRINLTSKPAEIEDKERKKQALDREIKALDRDKQNNISIDNEHYKDLKAQVKSLEKEIKELTAAWQKEKQCVEKLLNARQKLIVNTEKEKNKLKKEVDKLTQELKKLQTQKSFLQIEVNPDVVAQVVSDWTGIPLGKMLQDEARLLLNLEDKLKEQIKGQDQALEVISKVIKAGKAGIGKQDTPIGVFLLVGPSGVGKTETGLALAEILFGSRKQIVTVNMSEFQESHTVSRLIGSPPGYVGYGEGGMLTEAVRQKPYCVVLLDEVEKAHPDVLNLFYQVFDKGMLTDGEGKEISFKNTIIFLTSNLASDIIQEMTLEGEEYPPLDSISTAIRPILSKHFKPALLARMNLVPYYSLKKEALTLIVKLKLDKLANNLQESNKIKLLYTPEVVEKIADRCKEVETGARNIDFILNMNILPKLSEQILSHLTTGKMPSEVHLEIDKAGEFILNFK